MYSADSLGTIRAKSEYTYFDVVNEDGLDLEETSAPVLAALRLVLPCRDVRGKLFQGLRQGDLRPQRNSQHG